MKKYYFVAIGFLFIISGFAQNNTFKTGKAKKSQTIKHIQPKAEIPEAGRDANYVSIVDIGTAANAYAYDQKFSYLWVNPDLNTIVNIHTMGGALGGFSGDLAYDISKDGGQTWENMIELYQAGSGLVAHNPNQGIYNPVGNTNPDDAYVSYFSSAGYSYLHGVGDIGDTSYHTATELPSNNRFYQNAARGFDITTDGKVFALDANTDWTGNTPVYRDSLIITKGTWDESLEDFTYSRQSLEAVIDDSLGRPLDYKIAFGPDGQTGYIVVIGNNGEAEEVEGYKNLYPIYWKTTDGGETWGEPGFIQLDGTNGLPGIVYGHLTDEQIGGLFGDNPPPREEVSYTTDTDCDIIVDQTGYLHIAVVIGPTGADPYSIITAEDYIAAVDIFTKDGGESWEKAEMGRLRTYSGDIAGMIPQDNRIQITTNFDADKVFISWLDTDLEEETDNIRPNIWVRGFNPISYDFTLSGEGYCFPTNVTLFSEGMWQAYFGTAPKYCFYADGEYTIPYVYVELDPTNDLAPVQFKFIQDFSFSESDFYPCTVGIGEEVATQQPLLVYGNAPNPFREETNIQLELYQSENVRIMVYSLTGQPLFEKDFGKLDQGSHSLTLQMQDVSPGIYFYTVTAGQSRVTKKMVVE